MPEESQTMKVLETNADAADKLIVDINAKVSRNVKTWPVDSRVKIL